MKKTLSTVLFFSLFIFTQILFAQMHVTSNGSVGIGTNAPGDTTQLTITSDGTSNTNDKNQYLKVKYTGPSSVYNMTGIYSEVMVRAGRGFAAKFNGGRVGLQSMAQYPHLGTDDGYRYGVMGYGSYGQIRNVGIYAVGGSGTQTGLTSTLNYGILSSAIGSGNTNYGIYAQASGATTNWAGYFNGNVHCIGTVTWTSDEKFKEDVTALESNIENMKKLKPKKYQFKKDQKLRFDSGNHFGFLAQDLEKIYPDLVSITKHKIVKDPMTGEEGEIEGVEEIEYKSINYIELIPILVETFQEQQEIIENQQTTIDDLVKRVDKLEKKQ